MSGSDDSTARRWAIVPPAAPAAPASGSASGVPADPESTPLESEVTALAPFVSAAALLGQSARLRPSTEAPELSDPVRVGASESGSHQEAERLEVTFAEVEPRDSDRITEISPPSFQSLDPDSAARTADTIPCLPLDDDAVEP